MSNNSEYYTQKYLKYKKKYLSLKELIGAANPNLKFGTKSCPEEFGIFGFGKRNIKYYLENYNCNFNYLKEKLGEKKIEEFIEEFKEKIFTIDEIKELKKRDFPLSFFLLKNKNFENLINTVDNYEDFIKSGFKDEKILYKIQTLSFEKIFYEKGFSIKQILEIYPKYYMLDQFLNYMYKQPVPEYIIKNPIPYKMLKEAGFSPIELYVLAYFKNKIHNQYTLIIEYLKKMNKKAIGQFHDENNNTAEIFFEMEGRWTASSLKKLISISYFKTLFDLSKEMKQQKKSTPWDIQQFDFTKEELNKIDGKSQLEEKDKKVSLKNIGTATELKKISYNVQELKDAGFTLEELKAAGFTLEELKAAGL